MIRIKKEQMNEIAELFEGVEDSMVISCLQGGMGKAFADRVPEPEMALIVSGEYSFFGGDPSTAGARPMVKTLFDYIEGDATTAIYAENNLGWRDLLLTIPENHPEEVMRYGIVQKDYQFDRARLQAMIDSLPHPYELAPFDKDLYEQAMSQPWSREFCETFDSAEDFLAKGFAYGILYQGRLVSGASTMTVYDGGTEIQVATKQGFQQKGLAMPCSAALLLECMDRGIRPCWDAATLISKHMALKLGYEYRGEYSTIHMHK